MTGAPSGDDGVIVTVGGSASPGGGAGGAGVGLFVLSLRLPNSMHACGRNHVGEQYRCLSARRQAPRKTLPRLWQLIFLGEIGEAGNVGLELQRHGTRWSVALFADNDLSLAVDFFHFRLPFEVFFGSGPRFAIAQVIFFPEHKQHDVGVLLDGARLTQV